jgi:hypothetical protein
METIILPRANARDDQNAGKQARVTATITTPKGNLILS